MIVEEGPPSLGWRFSVLNHVLGDGGLSNLNAEHLQLPVHARRTPQGILPGEAANQRPHLP